MSQQTDAVTEFYRRPSRWSIEKRWVLLTRQRVERALGDALRETGTHLADAQLLDVGTGGGSYLNVLIGLGAKPGQCHGVDVTPERINQAREVCAAGDLRIADARDLPFPDASFDVVSQFTCFFNLFQADALQAASEIERVLRPRGRLIWFDLANITETDVLRQIPKPEELFPSLQPIWRQRLLHPWTELLNGHLLISELVERLPVRKTNLLVVFEKHRSHCVP